MLKLLLGDPNARKLKRYQPIVSDINLLEEEIAPLSDDQLRARTKRFQEQLANAGAWITSARSLMRFCPRPLLWFARRASGCWACAISMCS